MTEQSARPPEQRLHVFLAQARSAADRVELVPLSLITGFLVVLYWPAWPLVPLEGLDMSWRVGLTWAHQLGFAWGTDVIFTYGPMSFLDYPLANSRVGLGLSTLAWIVDVAALSGCVFALTGVRFAHWPRTRRLALTAGASALLLVIPSAAGLISFNALIPVGLALVALAVVTRTTRLAWLVGVVCGLLLVHKLSDAALVGAVSVVAVTATLGRGGLTRLAVATGASFILFWLASGQALLSVIPYVVNEMQIVFGFAPAMSTEQPGYLWHYPVAVALALGVLYCAKGITATPTRLGRYGFTAAIAVGLWVAGREAFTRHDSHYGYFFAIVVVLCVVLAIVATDRRALATVACVGVAAYLMVATVRMPLLAPVDRQSSLAGVSQALGAMSSNVKAQQLLGAAKQHLVDVYALTPELADVLRQRATSVDPNDISALFAVDGIWRTLPVLQSYHGYTAELDALVTRSLEDAPRQILRSVPYGAIDGRYPYWEIPRYQRLLYCSYEVSMMSPRWQVLLPGIQRCGVPEPSTSIDAAAGEVVQVPARERSITVVTITPIRSLAENAIEFLTKPNPIYVSYGPGLWRFASSPSAVELMLNAPIAHAAFADLPTDPLPSISMTHAARFEFAFVGVNP